jgi:hypothetical protein
LPFWRAAPARFNKRSSRTFYVLVGSLKHAFGAEQTVHWKCIARRVDTREHRTVQVRRVTVADAPELASVLAHSAQAAYRGIVSQAYLDELDSSIRRTRWTKTIEATTWPRTGTLAAVDNDEIVGLLNFAPSSDLDLDPNTAVEVTTMYVRGAES